MTTVSKVTTNVVLEKTLFGNLPEELLTLIHSFVTWDVTSMSYAIHVSQKQPRKFLNSWVPTTMNRKNGFHGQEESNTEDEHWALGNIEICLQAINCKTCGNYQSTSSMLLLPLLPSIQCHCLL